MLFQEQGLVRCSLRGEDAVLPANVSKTAIVVENILVPVQDCAHDQRIIGVADFRNKIWDDVSFFGRIPKRKRSFFSRRLRPSREHGVGGILEEVS